MKKLISILLLVSLLMSFCSCCCLCINPFELGEEPDFYDTYEPYEPDDSYEVELPADTYEPEEPYDTYEPEEPADTVFDTEFVETEAPAPVTTRPTPVTTAPPVVVEPSVPTFDDFDSLSKYINDQKKADVFNMTFYYTGDRPSAGEIARMCSACYVSYKYKGELYDLTVTEYPGDRIVDAYFAGNVSSLRADEKAAYDKAVDLVAQLKREARDAYELELLIHDAIIDMVTYHDELRDFEDPMDPPRNLTVVGALLDGRANCQGYTDAFYTLASIAGFTVSRIYVETEDDLHVANTILLDGKWYVVDTTFDDEGDMPISYRLFNVGEDFIREYTWPSYYEIDDVSPVSDQNYYYIRNGSIYENIDEMVQAVVARWAETGETKFSVMVKNDKAETIKQKLSAELDSTGRAYRYTYYYRYNDRAAYYTIVFN